MKKILAGIALLGITSLPMNVWAEGDKFDRHPVDYVNPFVGTTNYGTTHPGAICPQGMMSVVPLMSWEI